MKNGKPWIFLHPDQEFIMQWPMMLNERESFYTADSAIKENMMIHGNLTERIGQSCKQPPILEPGVIIQWFMTRFQKEFYCLVVTAVPMQRVIYGHGMEIIGSNCLTTVRKES